MPWRERMADVPFEGTFRRQIDLKAWDERTVVGWLEDEFHHFGITLIHDGTHVQDIRIAAPRHPWSTCAGAGVPLRALIGKPLISRCSDIGSLIDMRRQCTHVFDLAGLALAHACARRAHRRYHGTVRPLADVVPGAPQDRLRATLYRDGMEVLWWDLHEDLITAPAPYAGRSISRGFREWLETREQAQAEDASVLRRVAFVAKGRKISIEHMRVADDLRQPPLCHSFQPEYRRIAFRVADTRRRLDTSEGAMLGLVDTKP